MTEEKIKLQKKYGSSSKDNFKVIDTIGVPHPYCISNKHLEFNDSMYLGKEQIERMEKEHPDQVMCDICKKANNKNGDQILKFSEHKQALLVQCKQDMTVGKPDKDGKVKANPELHKYLLSIKDKATKDHYEGFTFLDARSKN